MKKLTEFINEALGGIAWSEFAKVWKGEHLDIDEDHLKNATYVFTELMQVHDNKLPTTEEFNNMCRWFVDTYKDQPYITEEYMEDLLYRFFDIFVMHTQKKTFTKTIEHTKYIDVGNDLYKKETSYKYLTKIFRDTTTINPDNRRVGEYNIRGYDDAVWLDRNYPNIIPRLFTLIFYSSSYIKRHPDNSALIENELKDFLKRWKISFKDFINKHDYSEGMRILCEFFKK